MPTFIEVTRQLHKHTSSSDYPKEKMFRRKYPRTDQVNTHFLGGYIYYLIGSPEEVFSARVFVNSFNRSLDECLKPKD